jgi:hypothetical protein
MHSRIMGFMMRHPAGVVFTAVLGAVFFLLYTATHLEFDGKPLDFVSAGVHYKQLNAAFSLQWNMATAADSKPWQSVTYYGSTVNVACARAMT